MVLHSILILSILYLYVVAIRSNIALNQRATQTHNSTWNGWTWTADHAVDGCSRADDPDNQYCCSTSDVGYNQPNWWRVDFDRYYRIDEGIITGRSGIIKNRLHVVHVRCHIISRLFRSLK